MGAADVSLGLASLMVFLGSYLLFFNWAYRIIFLLPAIIVLSRMQWAWARRFCLLALMVLWSPLFSVLWRYFVRPEQLPHATIDNHWRCSWPMA